MLVNIPSTLSSDFVDVSKASSNFSHSVNAFLVVSTETPGEEGREVGGELLLSHQTRLQHRGAIRSGRTRVAAPIFKVLKIKVHHCFAEQAECVAAVAAVAKIEVIALLKFLLTFILHIHAYSWVLTQVPTTKNFTPRLVPTHIHGYLGSMGSILQVFLRVYP
jgi:hypothetical protein